MISKQKLIDLTLYTLCHKIDKQLRTKYFQIIPIHTTVLYYNNFKINNPNFYDELISRQGEGNINLHEYKNINKDLLYHLDSDLAIYISQREKVEDALINLSNLTSLINFRRLMSNFDSRFEDGYGSKIENHPFWALYKKQELINKLWS